MVAVGIYEHRVRGIDADVQWVWRGVGLLKEAFQRLRSEVVGIVFTVPAHFKMTVAVELVEKGGELPEVLVQPGPEIPCDRKITAGGVHGHLLRQDVNNPVGSVLCVRHGAKGLR